MTLWLALWLVTGWMASPAIMAGQMDPDTTVHKELGLPSVRHAILGQFWTHTPAYYQLLVATNATKLSSEPVTHEKFAVIDATAVAELQLEQYAEALRIIGLKETVDGKDYALHANLSLIYARQALAGGEHDFVAGMEQAIREARIAAQLKTGTDPFHRNALYLRLLEWLVRVHADSTLRERECLLGYDLNERMAVARERDRTAQVRRSDPLTVADLAAMTGEEPGFVEALVALVTIDCLAIPDGLMALGQISEALGEVETAFFAYSRLQEMSQPYPRAYLDTRIKSLWANSRVKVALGAGLEASLALDTAGMEALNDQCFGRYLAARRDARAFVEAFDQFELQQLAKKPWIGTRRELEAFYHQQEGTRPETAAASPARWEDAPPAQAPDRLDPVQFLVAVAIWVPLALGLAGAIFLGVRALRRHPRLATQ